MSQELPNQGETDSELHQKQQIKYTFIKTKLPVSICFQPSVSTVYRETKDKKKKKGKMSHQPPHHKAHFHIYCHLNFISE